jgi:hypothetical protein
VEPFGDAAVALSHGCQTPTLTITLVPQP